tara:strand:+ start:126 stop:524 length:399 start_codon:yes stop_codon:yes gene_type:complete
MSLYVITGPPCAGKSTYAKENATPQDLVVDLDRIALAVAAEGTEHHSYPLAIRNTARLMRKAAIPAAILHSKTHDSYVIDSKPTTKARSIYRKHGAMFVELTAPHAVLVQRIKAERPAWVLQTLAQWYADPE